MKNFEEFSKQVKINESEVKFINEGEQFEELIQNIASHLRDRDVPAEETVNGNKATIKVGSDVYTIEAGVKIPPFTLSSKHMKPQELTSSELVSFWTSFIGEYHNSKHEYNNESLSVNEGTLSKAVEFGNDFTKKYPEYKSEVLDLFQLMKDEIEEGNSIDAEVESFISACKDLLKK